MLQKTLFADEKVLKAGEQIVLRPVSLDFLGLHFGKYTAKFLGQKSRVVLLFLMLLERLLLVHVKTNQRLVEDLTN